jgi:hypothetical protein
MSRRPPQAPAAGDRLKQVLAAGLEATGVDFFGNPSQPQAFTQRLDNGVRLAGDGQRNPEFDAFVNHCLKEATQLEYAFEDRYDDGRGGTEPVPVKDCFRMIKQLFDQCRGACNVKSDMAALRKDTWSPGDVLNLLCNQYTEVTILGYGRAGCTFKWHNYALIPPTKDNSNPEFVFKISVGVPDKIKQFYRIYNDAQNFAHQRARVSLGSLEQYMQRMSWVPKPNKVFDVVPVVQSVDNTPLTLPCTLLMMALAPGSSAPPPDWAAAAGLPSQNDMIRQLDALLKQVGVNHDDITEPGNMLYDYNQGPPPTVDVKVLDFGQATPSVAVQLSVGQP